MDERLENQELRRCGAGTGGGRFSSEPELAGAGRVGVACLSWPGWLPLTACGEGVGLGAGLDAAESLTELDSGLGRDATFRATLSRRVQAALAMPLWRRGTPKSPSPPSHDSRRSQRPRADAVRVWAANLLDSRGSSSSHRDRVCAPSCRRTAARRPTTSYSPHKGSADRDWRPRLDECCGAISPPQSPTTTAHRGSQETVAPNGSSGGLQRTGASQRACKRRSEPVLGAAVQRRRWCAVCRQCSVTDAIWWRGRQPWPRIQLEAEDNVGGRGERC